MATTEARYAFQVQWLDNQADMIRRYVLTFYPRDNSIEMYDPKNKRAFLKRTEYTEISLNDLYIGSFLSVHARQLEIIDYADSYTRRMVESRKARTLAVIKPDAYNHMGQIMSALSQNGLHIGQLAMLKLTPDQAHAFCAASEMPQGNAAHLCSDVVTAIELHGEDAINNWMALGDSIRNQIGSDDVRNAVHCSQNSGMAEREIDFFFGGGQKFSTTALFNNCTLCIIRPHALKNAGDIISRIIAEGFEISALKMWHLDKIAAEEFVDVYKGVLPEYQEISHQMVVGPCLVMEVRQKDAVNAFRKLVGPHDPEVAKHLRPDTIRAQFGIDRVRNAVHCTDLPEDGLLEVEYFFNTLYNR